MATFGSVNNTAVDVWITSSGPDYQEGVWGGSDGTITDISLFLKSAWSGSESFRFGIYTGGSAGDPSGADLLWDSGKLAVNISDEVGAWFSLTSDLGGSINLEITAGSRVWFTMKLNDSLVAGRNTDLDEGDWANTCYKYSGTGLDNVTDNAFPDPWPANTNVSTHETPKVIFTFTPAAGASTVTPNAAGLSV